MTASEFAEWQAFDVLDPIGGYRGDVQAAIVASSMGGGKLSDYLLIDPNPMTDEMREEYEYYERLRQLEQEQTALIDKFNRMQN